MNWDIIKGNWKQMKGRFTATCGKLTDDDMRVFQGKRSQLAGTLQARYGTAREVTSKVLKDLGRPI